MKVYFISVVVLSLLSNVKCSSLHFFEKTKYKDNLESQGLYNAEDKMEILTKDNFNSNVYGKQNAWVIEFYNSWCGFCKRFAPEWRQFASDVHNWHHIVTIGAIDCADDKNQYICREFEILAYPTIKYFHENYTEGAKQFGEAMKKGSNALELRELLVTKLQQEQIDGRGKNWPSLRSENFTNLADVWTGLPSNIKAVFLIFDSVNSTLGSEVILDLEIVFGISIRKVSRTSDLTKSLNIERFPSIVAIERGLSTNALTPKDSSRINFRKAVLMYMQSKKIVIPQTAADKGFISEDLINFSSNIYNGSALLNKKVIELGDVAFQADLETGLRYSLSHEITQKKTISGESLEALCDYLRVLAKYFPFTANGKIFVTELRDRVLQDKSEWTGKELSNTISKLEEEYAPVYSTLSEWIGCKGSSPQFRGFTCALWTMFHVLTVNAASLKSSDSSEVLRAMHGYVKYFFGCSDCSEHFQALSQLNKLNAVAENDGAILWLWVAHNNVNHRIAGDLTEDPQHPKKQFPVSEHCPKCRLAGGGWDLKEVLNYLKDVYGTSQLNLTGAVPHPPLTFPLSTLDMALFGLLYIYSAIMLIFVIRLFLSKRIYKKKTYIHDTFGKV